MPTLQPADRGPLIIAGGIVLAGVFIALALYLGRAGSAQAPTEPTEPFDPRATATASSPTPTVDPQAADSETIDGLRRVANAASRLGVPEGTFTAADTLTLGEELPQYTYLPSTRPSSRANELSVLAESGAWAAASKSASGTCYWVRLTLSPDGTEALPSYGAGEPCTGQAASTASGNTFPSA